MSVRVREIWGCWALIGALGVIAPPAFAASPLRLTALGDFRQPVHVTGSPPEPRAVYVLERGGRVWRIGRSGRRHLVLDARPLVRLLAPEDQFRDQGGAFALALPPGHRPGGRVYLLYTRVDGRVHLDEFRPGPRGRPGRPRTLLSVPRHSRVDVGGDAAFGPDGLLYASFGFGGRPDASQDPARLNGKVVRLDPLARTQRPELFASGLRVPWRLSFDPPRRRLIVADVGEAAFEEVNVLPLRARAPANLGWPYFEGRRRRTPGGPAGMVAPFLALRHGRGMCAIVGGYVVRTPTLPELRGRYLYGDLCSGGLRSVRLTAGGAVGDRSERTAVRYLVSFGRDGGGRIYAVSLKGRVYRLG